MPEKKLSEKEISNLPDKEVKVIVIKLLTGLERRVDAISEMKNTLNGINNRLEDTEDQNQ